MGTSKVSVIIPTLNEESVIKKTVEAAAAGDPHEIIIVDGGSRDGTFPLAASLTGVRTLRSPDPGRSKQMNFGASQSDGDILLFLHADTLLPNGWQEEIASSLVSDAIQGGCFTVALSNRHFVYRLTGAMINLRTILFRSFTGDQAIFVRRSFFEEAGGFPDVPLMEDLTFSDLMRRSGSVLIRKPVVTSARKWEKGGPLRTILLMWYLKFLFRRGRSPEELVSYYIQGKFPPLRSV